MWLNEEFKISWGKKKTNSGVLCLLVRLHTQVNTHSYTFKEKQERKEKIIIKKRNLAYKHWSDALIKYHIFKMIMCNTPFPSWLWTQLAVVLFTSLLKSIAVDCYYVTGWPKWISNIPIKAPCVKDPDSSLCSFKTICVMIIILMMPPSIGSEHENTLQKNSDTWKLLGDKFKRKTTILAPFLSFHCTSKSSKSIITATSTSNTM